MTDYLPGHGDPSFSVSHYDLALDYSVEQNQLDGVATLTVTALADLDQLKLDLHHLSVSKVAVSSVRSVKYTHRGGRLVIKTPWPPARPAR